VVQHRASLELDTTWDEALSYLLAPALASYETERLTGSALGGTEFQLAVKRAVPHGCTFKGFPQHFTHQHAPSMLASLMQSTTGLDIVQCTGEQVRLALRLRVFLYPDDVCAVWVMLASTHRAAPP
jgi:centrosomal protein CEP76